MLSIVFCGFGSLAVNCLNALYRDNIKIRYILTHPGDDKDSVISFAKEKGIEYATDDLRKNGTLLQKIIKDTNLCANEYLVSVNYRYILPEKFFLKFNRALNIHGGPLPRYRGRTPHVWSIINGEEHCAITCHIMSQTVDAGDIICQIPVAIDDNDTGHTLLMKMHALYPDVLLKSIACLLDGIRPVPQDNSIATYYGKRSPDMGYILFNQNYKGIYDFVRALAPPYPGAYCFMPDGSRIIISSIKKAPPSIEKQEIGRIFRHNSKLYVSCMDCVIEIVSYTVNS